MARKLSKSSLNLRLRWLRRLCLAAVTLTVVVIVGTVAYSIGWQKASGVAGDREFRSTVISKHIESVYRGARAAVHNPGDTTDLYIMYDDSLSSELAAKVKSQGPSVLFCDKRPPLDIFMGTPQDPSLNTGESHIDIHLSMTEAPVVAADSKSVRIGYDWKSLKLTKVTCLN